MTTGGAELSWGGAMTRCSCEGRQASVPVNPSSNRTGCARRPTSPESVVQVSMICSSSCQRAIRVRGLLCEWAVRSGDDSVQYGKGV